MQDLPRPSVQLAEVLVRLVRGRLDLEGRVAYVEVLGDADAQLVEDRPDATLGERRVGPRVLLAAKR